MRYRIVTKAGAGALAPERVADYLSGLLQSAPRSRQRGGGERTAVAATSIALVGQAAPCERFRRALALARSGALPRHPDAAACAPWRIDSQVGIAAP